ncbi:MAG: SMC-Scp complex subunit ScpB [Ruminococcaceae bacterium]|nr:SMC-Scp complex subunit ScpB [Oscillospiraceae bacterium]
MEIVEGMAIIEAILFAYADPITIDRLSEASGIDPDTAAKIISQLERRYSVIGSGLRIIRLGNAFQLSTQEELSSYVKAALDTHKQTPLSQAALECLAVIAYNQPVTKGFVEQIRGIDSSGVVNTLVEKGLIEEAGRLELPGRPIAYRTTDTFLRCFGLNSLENLPPLPTQEGQLSLDELDGIDQQEIDEQAERLARQLDIEALDDIDDE